MSLDAKFEVGQTVYYKGRKTVVTSRSMIDVGMLNIRYEWKYNVKGYRNSIREKELISEKDTPVLPHQIDFDCLVSMYDAICPSCKRYNFDDDFELFGINEETTEATCPVCESQFKLTREFIPQYSFAQSEDKDYLNRVKKTIKEKVK